MLERQEQTDDGKLISGKISVEIMIQSKALMRLAHTCRTLWFPRTGIFIEFFQKEVFPTSVAYCALVIMGDLNLWSSQGNRLKGDMTQNFK